MHAYQAAGRCLGIQNQTLNIFSKSEIKDEREIEENSN